MTLNDHGGNATTDSRDASFGPVLAQFGARSCATAILHFKLD